MEQRRTKALDWWRDLGKVLGDRVSLVNSCQCLDRSMGFPGLGSSSQGDPCHVDRASQKEMAGDGMSHVDRQCMLLRVLGSVKALVSMEG